MRTKKEIENEIVNIKKQMETLSSTSSQAKVDPSQLLKDNEEKIGTQLFTLLKYMIEENKRTTMFLKGMSESIERLEDELAYYHEETSERKTEPAQPQFTQKEVPLSGIDAKLIQNIQLARTGMACADDLKAKMNYKGRNAVSARLNRLYRMGILERYQLGKKVYYKYDAGKQTNILIVSPSQ